jgi:hypothetical protein
MAAARTASLRAAGPGSTSALAAGYRLAVAAAIGLTVAATIVAATVLRPSGNARRQRQPDSRPPEIKARTGTR